MAGGDFHKWPQGREGGPRGWKIPSQRAEEHQAGLSNNQPSLAGTQCMYVVRGEGSLLERQTRWEQGGNRALLKAWLKTLAFMLQAVGRIWRDTGISLLLRRALTCLALCPPPPAPCPSPPAKSSPAPAQEGVKSRSACSGCGGQDGQWAASSLHISGPGDSSLLGPALSFRP